MWKDGVKVFFSEFRNHILSPKRFVRRVRKIARISFVISARPPVRIEKLGSGL